MTFLLKILSTVSNVVGKTASFVTRLSGLTNSSEFVLDPKGPTSEASPCRGPLSERFKVLRDVVTSLPSTIKQVAVGGALASSAVYFGPVTVISYTPFLFEIFLAYSVVYRNLETIGKTYELGKACYSLTRLPIPNSLLPESFRRLFYIV